MSFFKVFQASLLGLAGTGIRSAPAKRGGVFIPAIPGAVSVGVFVQGQFGNGYLIDLRLNGSNYWYAEGTDNPNRITVDGKSITYDEAFLRTSRLLDKPTPQKVYLEFATTANGFHWFCRYDNKEPATPSTQEYVSFSGLTVYGRAWTAAERLNATGPLPTDNILARYDDHIANGMLLDASGNGYHAALIGGPLEAFSY